MSLTSWIPCRILPAARVSLAPLLSFSLPARNEPIITISISIIIFIFVTFTFIIMIRWGAPRTTSTTATTATSTTMKCRNKLPAAACDDDDVNFDEPLLFQVGRLGTRYEKWVHEPRLSATVPRFFKSSMCEFFTVTPWWVIPLVWLPLVVYTQTLSLQRGLPSRHLPWTIITGMLLWTFVEYLLHRYLFHMHTSSYWGNTFHYFIHGFHHKHPMDTLRLVFPPLFSTLLSAPLWLATNTIFPRHVAPSLYGGGLFGYILYDLTHYYLHHGNPHIECIRRLKKNHIKHHYKGEGTNFGVTSPIWDFIFGTMP